MSNPGFALTDTRDGNEFLSVSNNSWLAEVHVATRAGERSRTLACNVWQVFNTSSHSGWKNKSFVGRDRVVNWDFSGGKMMYWFNFVRYSAWMPWQQACGTWCKQEIWGCSVWSLLTDRQKEWGFKALRFDCFHSDDENAVWWKIAWTKSCGETKNLFAYLSLKIPTAAILKCCFKWFWCLKFGFVMARVWRRRDLFHVFCLLMLCNCTKSNSLNEHWRNFCNNLSWSIFSRCSCLEQGSSALLPLICILMLWDVFRMFRWDFNICKSLERIRNLRQNTDRLCLLPNCLSAFSPNVSLPSLSRSLSHSSRSLSPLLLSLFSKSSH